jgi:hypothetical protein
MTMFESEASGGRWSAEWRRSLIARCGIAVAVAGAIALGAPGLAGANYCIGHPTAEGCNLNIIRVGGPHITAAGISRGRMHLRLTFHKAGRFVAHLKRNPPPNPYGRGWGPRPKLGERIPIGFHPAGAGSATIPLGTLAPGRYGVVILPTKPVRSKPGQPVDRKTVPSWVYFTERAGRAVSVRVLQP